MTPILSTLLVVTSLSLLPQTSPLAMPLHPHLPTPPALTSVTPGTWAHDTMSRRVEADILARLEAENSEELNTPPFKEAKEKISALRSELRSSSRIRHILGDPSFDLDLRDWGKIMKGVVDDGHTYLSAPWLTAEFYVYRRVVEAFNYFNPSSPTYLFDPFLKQKLAGLEVREAVRCLAVLDEATCVCVCFSVTLHDNVALTRYSPRLALLVAPVGPLNPPPPLSPASAPPRPCS